jgi:putative ABC transport system ATP-binding protein
MGLFETLNRSGKTIVLVTHEPDIARHAQRLLAIHDGHLASDTRRTEEVEEIYDHV